MRKSTAVLKNVLSFTLSIMLSLFLCEFIVRHFIHVRHLHFTSKNGLKWNMPHPRKEYTLTPNFSGQIITTEYQNSININSLGFRGPEPLIGRVAAKKRIFVIGDSFIFGAGVAYENTIPAKLEHYLNELYNVNTEVWNLGCPGYTIQQYIYTLQDYIRYKPEYVILCFNISKIPLAGDDVRAADFEQRERAYARFSEKMLPENSLEAQSGRIKSFGLIPSFIRYLRSGPAYAVKKWLLRHSALYNYLYLRLGIQIRAIIHKYEGITLSDRLRISKGWAIFDERLRYLKELSALYGFKVVIICIAQESDIINNERGPSERLSELSIKYGLKYISAFEIFSRQQAHRVYYPIDGHFNIKGCDLTAKKIAENLEF